MILTEPNVKHGLSGYTNKGCRCDVCREANRAYSAKRLLDPKAREKNRAASLAWQRANPEAALEKTRAWYERPGNREKNRVAVRAWKKANPEANREINRAWLSKPGNREKALVKEQRRNALKLDQFVEDIDRRVLADRDGWECGICHAIIDSELKYPDPGSLSVDHVVPLSKGGEHSYANTQASHLVCNKKKGNR